MNSLTVIEKIVADKILFMLNVCSIIKTIISKYLIEAIVYIFLNMWSFAIFQLEVGLFFSFYYKIRENILFSCDEMRYCIQLIIDKQSVIFPNMSMVFLYGYFSGYFSVPYRLQFYSFDLWNNCIQYHLFRYLQKCKTLHVIILLYIKFLPIQMFGYSYLISFWHFHAF